MTHAVDRLMERFGTDAKNAYVSLKWMLARIMHNEGVLLETKADGSEIYAVGNFGVVVPVAVVRNATGPFIASVLPQTALLNDLSDAKFDELKRYTIRVMDEQHEHRRSKREAGSEKGASRELRREGLDAP